MSYLKVCWSSIESNEVNNGEMHLYLMKMRILNLLWCEPCQYIYQFQAFDFGAGAVPYSSCGISVHFTGRDFRKCSCLALECGFNCLGVKRRLNSFNNVVALDVERY